MYRELRVGESPIKEIWLRLMADILNNFFNNVPFCKVQNNTLLT